MVLLQLFSFWDSSSTFLLVFLLIGLVDLITEIGNLAISLGLSLIASDDADNLLCICL